MLSPIQETIFDFIEGPGAFYGYFLQKLYIHIDNTQPTLYVYSKDSRLSMGYNDKFFNSLTYKERMAVIEHEILHIANNHTNRFCAERERNKEKDNAYLIGTDCAINQLVDDMPKGSVDLKGVNKILQNNNITTQDIEPNKEAEYYVELLKKVKGKNKGGCNHFDRSGEEKGLDELSRNEIEEILKECGREAGHIPRGIDKVLEELTRITKLNWKQLLRMSCSRSIKAETRRSWKRLNRRSEVEIKGTVCNYKPRIVVAIDTSGSIYSSPGTLEEFTGQLVNIKQCFGGEFMVVECDTMIQKVYKLTRGLKPDRCYKGGGGTDFSPVFDLCEKELHPGLLIFFTDGEGSFPTQKPNFKTLWASIYDNKTKFPFGDYIKIDIKNA